MKYQRSLLPFATTAMLLLAASVDAGQRTVTRAQREAETEQARFRAWDRNADGVITRQEWRGSARSFTLHDTNRDGTLSGSEIWIGGRRRPAPDTDARAYTEEDQRRDELLEAFYRADRNDDGRLAGTEWWSDRATFDRVDRNRDGFVSEREYVEHDEMIEPPPAAATEEARRETPAYTSGHERGLLEGRQAGKEDKTLRNEWDLEGQRELEQADSGYAAQVGPRDEYQAGYRAGFRLGYKQGFGPR